ncbi:phosphotransferase family protein [Sphingomonas jeddahensis]|uniref:Phosphotransferase enzyme family protein n=1 Tax=Sphingomonas jeddahensis TaxID=1915074 RepID=A0A1V2EXR2_9SPHN|nr:phosphotransferase family protein [Sphingomonas jeddahensis]ONF97390.1 Phosphotransferase enzyme family protein [Sphingomonas jeddahensis]
MADRLSKNELAERLTVLAPRMVPGAERIENLVRLTGGASMATWAFDAMDGAGTATPLILRRRDRPVEYSTVAKPPLRREAAAIARAVEAGVPAPIVAYVCDEETDGLDEAYVMHRVSGETLGKKIASDPAFEPARGKLAHQCGAALARIHALEPLDGLDSTDAETTLANYERTWRATGNVRPTIEAAFRWLEKRLPPEKVTPRMVHGDFRNGNIMVDPNEGLVAVLDWEIVHIGDPAEDLGWLCTNSWKFGRPDRYVGGFGELDDLLAGYAEAGGEPMSAARVDFWSMLGSLKWGVMTMGMYASFASDPSAGPERAVIGRRLSETEADIVAIIERNAA